MIRSEDDIGALKLAIAGRNALTEIQEMIK